MRLPQPGATFAASLLRQLEQIAALWERHWERIAPALAYPLPIRRVLYTTNAIESPHVQLRKVVITRGHFTNHKAASKLLYLALRGIRKK